MRAVWSFWSKPFRAGTGWPWRSPMHHLLAWGLSVQLARSHYPDTVLITDKAGRALLVDALGLRFGEVSTALDQLDDADSDLWMLGKLLAYSLQQEPFVHLDADVFLWRPLPVSLVSAPVFAQHLDEFPVDKWGGPLVIEDAFLRAGLALPVEWRWIRSQSRRTFPEANLGIFGGTDSCFTRYYARSALDLALNPGHAAAWASIPHGVDVSPVVEQFMFTAYAAYHRFAPDSPHRGLSVRYLFPTQAEAYNPEYARRLGYTHLLGDAKHHPETTARLAERVRSEDPEFYARCQAIVGGLVPESAVT